MFVPPLMTLLQAPVSGDFYSYKGLNSGWQMVHSPSAIYVASLDKTFLAWCAVGRGGDKATQVAAFDHATGTWSDRVTVGNYTLADDDHGHPAMCRDSSGYLYCFFGSHDTTQPWASSNAPDDITAWTMHAPLAGAQTYPHPNVVGGAIYLFLRNDGVSTRRNMAVRSATPASGLATFTSLANIIDFDADSRVYTSEAHTRSTDVHFVCTRANASDSERKHVYYFVYKTATGAVTNHDGTTSVASGSLPVTLTQANASFRLIDYGSGQGEVPSLTFDSNGDPHVIYADNGGAGTTYTLRHIKRTSGVWSSPVNVDTVTDIVPGGGAGTGFVTMYGITPGPVGTVEAWYVNALGDKLRRTRSAAGVWSSAETVVVAGSLKLLGQQAVRDADPQFRTIFSEVSGSSADSGAVPIKCYAYGDSGLLNVAVPAGGSLDPLWNDVVIMLGFEHRDGSARITNEADTCKVVTASANAQTDTAQAKFGTSSLLLDAVGDHLIVTHDALLSASNGDFTVECWVRRTSSKLQCICGKRPSAAAAEYAFYIDATHHLVLQAFSTSVAVVNITGTGTLSSTSTWYHCAATRQGNTWRCFLDGVLQGTATESGTVASNALSLLIGRDNSNTARDLGGWIDEFRFTAGTARYTATFTPPSAAFPRR